MKTEISTIRPLSMDESVQITAGESLWYWIAYGVGATGRAVVYTWNYMGAHPEEFIAF